MCLPIGYLNCIDEVNAEGVVTEVTTGELEHLTAMVRQTAMDRLIAMDRLTVMDRLTATVAVVEGWYEIVSV